MFNLLYYKKKLIHARERVAHFQSIVNDTKQLGGLRNSAQTSVLFWENRVATISADILAQVGPDAFKESAGASS